MPSLLLQSRKSLIPFSLQLFPCQKSKHPTPLPITAMKKVNISCHPCRHRDPMAWKDIELVFLEKCYYNTPSLHPKDHESKCIL